MIEYCQSYRGYVTLGGKDDLARPIQQINHLGTTVDAEIVFPYGMHANLAVGSLVTVLNICDQPSNKIAFGGMPNRRETLPVNEVMFFHPITGAKIHFKNNGEIFIKSGPTELTIDSANNVTIISNVAITGNVTIDGNLDVTGNINSDASITAATEVTAGTVTVTGHDHDFAYIGAGDGSSPQAGTTDPGQG